VKIVTNGQVDTVPFPLLDKQMCGSIQQLLKRMKVNGSCLLLQ